MGSMGTGLRSVVLLNDGDFVFFGQIIHDDVEHEAVELRFRKRVCAFHFDGVLGRQNIKGFLTERGGHQRR